MDSSPGLGMTAPNLVHGGDWEGASQITGAGFDEVSREQLDKIKARTMYNMVEPIDGGLKKVLFLTNNQASLLSKEPASMNKMLDRLEVGKPQLVISLLESCGFGGFTKAYGEWGFNNAPPETGGCNGVGKMGWGAGLVSHRSPFLSVQAEMIAEGKVDTFMTEVLLPLAADTHAVVICNAIPARCILSASFLRMFAAKRAMWGVKSPFTILSVTNDMYAIYTNKSLDAYWREVSRKSRSWMLREARIIPILSAYFKGNVPERHFDLDQNATNFIIIDNIDEKKNKFDGGPFDRFMNELVRLLSSRLPSLAIKAGFSMKFPISFKVGSCLAPAANAAQSGTPTLLLDVRDRPTLSPTVDRAQLIAEAKTKFQEHCATFLEAGVLDCFDVGTFAYFHDVLTGDGSSLTTETSSRGGSLQGKDRTSLPLHLAIIDASDDNEGSTATDEAASGVMRRADTQQINDTVDFVVDRYFRDSWEILDEDQQKKSIDYATLWQKEMFALRTFGRVLLSSENMYHVNLADIAGSAKLVNKLVRLDRLPKHNPLEGLLLLRSAWDDYDVAMMLAGRYKCWCKLLFIVQLVLGWLVVTVSTASTFVLTEQIRAVLPESETVSAWLIEGLFVLSLVLSMIVSLDSLLDYKEKWRELRRGSGALLSTIWTYRTRVGKFEMEENPGNGAGRPERELMTTLQTFRRALKAGANLGTSNFHKKHSSSTYKHFQKKGIHDSGTDDFQSPVQPQRYIDMRIKKNISFYQARIPRYNRAKSIFKLLVVFLSVTASALARYRLVSLVVAVTAASAALTSWVEFTDMSSKAKRYTEVISGLKDLLDWWNSLTQVQKASREKIGQLITTSESLIAEEQIGWMSMSKNKDEGETKDGGGESRRSEGSTKVQPVVT